jgi:hypothetical protein
MDRRKVMTLEESLAWRLEIRPLLREALERTPLSLEKVAIRRALTACEGGIMECRRRITASKGDEAVR